MAAKPLVSCLIPAYNYGSLIDRAIDSALAQDYGAENLEIIVVDDGSTDNTAEVVARYGRHVRYVLKENGGVVSAVNRLVEEAGGEFLALLDADDEWPPDKVRRQVEIFDGRPELGLVYSDMEVIDTNGAVVEPSYFRMLSLSPPRGRIWGALLERNYVGTSAMLIRASLKDAFRGLPSWLTTADWSIAARVSMVAEADLIDEPLYRYRKHDESKNLGKTGTERLRRVTGREIELRRWLLADARPALATERELLAGYAGLERAYNELVTGLDAPLASLVVLDRDQPAASRDAAAAGYAALGAGDSHTAVCRFVNALALNPLNGDARAGLAVAARPEAGRPARPAPSPLSSLRDFAVLAFADELVAQPDLLAAYDGVFAADDDATLVIYAPGWEEERVGREIGGVLHAAGVEPDACADLLALAIDQDPQSEREIARRVQAVLSSRPAGGEFAGRPAFAAPDVPRLREIASRHWAA